MSETHKTGALADGQGEVDHGSTGHDESRSDRLNRNSEVQVDDGSCVPRSALLAEIAQLKYALSDERARVKRVEMTIEVWESDAAKHLSIYGQHLMRGAVETCAERIRAALSLERARAIACPDVDAHVGGEGDS